MKAKQLSFVYLFDENYDPDSTIKLRFALNEQDIRTNNKS